MIDFVIVWVDGSDPKWLEEKRKYMPDFTQDDGSQRYRDWNSLRYFFRGVESFAPWVRKIHFVTYGHLPEWLDTSNSKLHIVNHRDFIPEKYLPTFNSHTIELNLHRIEGLANQFVYFNDDMFLTSAVNESYFFYNGLPCDEFILDPVYFAKDSAGSYNGNDLEIINSYFNLKKIRKNGQIPLWKIYSSKYGIKNLYRNLTLMRWPWFSGFHYNHLPTSFAKPVFEEVWDREFGVLDATCMDRFRSKRNVNQWLFKYWQLASGMFYPRNPGYGKAFHLKADVNHELIQSIEKQRYRMICINDTAKTKNFEAHRDAVNAAFEKILPLQSSYEKRL